MRFYHTYIYALSILILSSCATIKESSKYQLVDGVYESKNFGNKKTSVYVNVAEDSVAVYRLSSRNQNFNMDTLQSVSISFPVLQKKSLSHPYTFTQISFDLDVLTIPFKYRPSTANFPNQLNANFNGALYAGYRRDIYKLTYRKAPQRIFERQISHYGASMGLFTGLGNTAMNPWVTNDQINSEYDGLVWLKGIAGIIGINNFTFGLSIGIDHLLDRNHKVWIYQGKPWVGLALGLNLN